MKISSFVAVGALCLLPASARSSASLRSASFQEEAEAIGSSRLVRRRESVASPRVQHRNLPYATPQYHSHPKIMSKGVSKGAHVPVMAPPKFMWPPHFKPKRPHKSQSKSTFLEVCLDGSACLDPSKRRVLMMNKAGRSNHGYDKNTCCSGGASAIKVVYHGDNQAAFFTSEAVEGLSASDPCDDKIFTIAADGKSTIAFADCDNCFPAESASLTCDPSTDVSLSQLVNPGDSLCLVSVDPDTLEPTLDSKLPTETLLYYQVDDIAEVLTSMKLHTSCSKPIYPPYAFLLDECFDGSSMYNLDDGPPTDPYLEFVDGVGAKKGELFSSCQGERSVKILSWSTSAKSSLDDDTCCEGGVTFLKMVFEGPLDGALTLDGRSLSLPCDSVSSKHIGSLKGHFPVAEDLAVRFIPCDDPCTDYADNLPCTSTDYTVSVEPGDELCVATVDKTGSIQFDIKMPTNVYIYFTPNGGGDALVAPVHMSCSEPVYPPFGQVFASPCVSSWPRPLDVSQFDGSVQVYVAFIDGLSRSYYESALHLGLLNSTDVDINFADCGCNCPDSSPTLVTDAFPSVQPVTPPTLGVTLEPTTFPTSGVGTSDHTSPSSDGSTTIFPTLALQVPIAEPPQGVETTVPVNPLCELDCADWVYDNCVVRDDQGGVVDERCVIPPDFTNRFLEAKSEMDHLTYHEQMIRIYTQVLSWVA